MHKHIMEDAVCGRCVHPVEDRDHVFFDCPVIAEFWNYIGLTSLATTSDFDGCP